MSSINVQTFRVDDEDLLRVRLNISNLKSDSVRVQFKSSKQQLSVVSTSLGMINHDTVILHGTPEYFQVFVQKPELKEDCECLISYFNGSNIVHSESLSFQSDKPGNITPAPTEISAIKSSGYLWKTRINQFQEVIQGRKQSSVWNASVSIKEDIVLNFNTKSKKGCYMAFGPDGDTLCFFDYIFSVSPQDKQIVIPVESFWRKYEEYGTTINQVACFEIITPDFVTIPNAFYKRKLSGYINVKDIPESNYQDLLDFRTPTGSVFNNQQWEISDISGLPVYRG